MLFEFLFSDSLAARLRHLLAAHQALIFLVVLAVLGRLLPHPDNMTPLAAIGIFAGAYLDRRQFLLVPLMAIFISDLLGPGLYSPVSMVFVYAGLMISALCGRLLLHQHNKLTRLPVTVLISAFSFYAVSNLGPWWAYYTHSLEGLLTCYANGLPFLARSLAGDAMYSLIFFASYGLMQQGLQRRHATA